MQPSPASDPPPGSAAPAPVAEAGAMEPTTAAPNAPGAGEPILLPKRRRGLGIVVAAIVVVVLVVLVLLFSGLLGVHSIGGIPLPGAGSSSAAPETFQAAYASANESAQTTDGGPWYLVVASGFDSATLTSFDLFGAAGSSPCVPDIVPTFQNEPTSDIAKGTSANWVIGFSSASGATDLTIVVVGGVVTNFGTTPSSDDCLGSGTVGLLAPASTIEDSSAAAAALGTNLTNFVGKFPSGGISALLLSDEGGGAVGEASGTAVWAFDVSPCLTNYSSGDLFAAGDPAFLGGVNATGHQVLVDLASPGIGYCETPGTLSDAFAVGPGTETAPPAGSGWAWTFNIGKAGSGLTFGEMTPTYVPALLTGPLGAASSSSLSLTVLGVTGSTVAAYNFTTSNWTLGAGTPVETGETIEFVAGSDLTGNALVFVGEKPFTGEVTVSLP